MLNPLQIAELEKVENANNYKALQKPGLHYFEASENESDTEEKQKNLSKALNYFEKAYSIGKNESDFPKTTYYYGLANYRGKDLKLAFKHISESADREYLPAMFYLGGYYENGVGTTVDNKKAVEYYKPVASQFNRYQAIACDRLGRLYYHKLKDSDKAAQWLIKAVNLGYTRATYLLFTIDDKYVKDIAIYDEETQRAMGLKFNKEGELYNGDCNEIIVASKSKNTLTKKRHSLNLKTVPEKQDPVFPLTYYKKRNQIDDAKRSILESIGGKQIKFSSSTAPLYFPSITQEHPFLGQSYNFVKKVSLDSIYQIQKKVKSHYSFYRVYINKNKRTFYVFVIESKSLSQGYYRHNLIQVGKVGLYEFELYTVKDKSFRTYNYPLNNIPWYFIADNIENHTHYDKD